MASKVTINQLLLMVVTQTIPDILVPTASAHGLPEVSGLDKFQIGVQFKRQTEGATVRFTLSIAVFGRNN